MIFGAMIFRYKLNHVFFWLLVFAAWYYLRYQDYTSAGIAFAVTAIKVADLALVVYLVNGWLIPRFLYQGKYAVSIVCFLLAIFVSGLLKAYVLNQVIGDAGKLSLKVRLYENVISDFFLVTSGAAIKLVADYLAIQRRMAVMAREKAETELAFLKSQINPHFLFNSLNAVYFLIHKDNKEAREALHTFSEMLRYQLYEARGARIPIEKELGYLGDYVAMQKLRRDEGYELSFSCGEGLTGFTIEPLLLIPFVENAFKHLSHRSGQVNFARIRIGRDNGSLVFDVENSYEGQTANPGGSGGIGLANVKRRLELLYPGRHRLNIFKNEQQFAVHLEIAISYPDAPDPKSKQL